MFSSIYLNYLIDNYILRKMNTLPHSHHIFGQQQPFIDPDVQHLKLLIAKTRIIEPTPQPQLWRQQEPPHQISALQKNIAQLTHKLHQQQKLCYQVTNELRAEKQQRRQDQIIYENKIRVLSQQIEEVNKHNTSDKTIQRSSMASRSSPFKMVDSFHFRRTETPINELLQMNQHFSPTQDQIHRLNSYLIENTTTLKLLLEKHNYLLKLRSIGAANDREQRQLLIKAKKTINDRKVVQQANFNLSSSRKDYIQNDSSSSEIEIENNVIIQKEE